MMKTGFNAELIILYGLLNKEEHPKMKDWERMTLDEQRSLLYSYTTKNSKGDE